MSYFASSILALKPDFEGVKPKLKYYGSAIGYFHESLKKIIIIVFGFSIFFSYYFSSWEMFSLSSKYHLLLNQRIAKAKPI